MEDLKTKEEKAQEGRFGIGMIVGLAGLVIFGIQIYSFLRYGTWETCSVVSCWMSNVNVMLFDFYISWEGVYKILDILPLALSLMMVGGLILFIVEE
jgi:hypothetical protein